MGKDIVRCIYMKYNYIMCHNIKYRYNEGEVIK